MASEDGAAAREKDPANFDVLFAGVAVRDFPAARAWYEDFFAHPADVVAHENEVMWQVTDRAWLYVVCDTARAGQSVVTVAVPDIEEATATLRSGHRDRTDPVRVRCGEEGNRAGSRWKRDRDHRGHPRQDDTEPRQNCRSVWPSGDCEALVCR
jgi:hypothetical protein